MSHRMVKYKPNTYISNCPKCNNNTKFRVKSEQVAEDMCEIWAVCVCGYDPTLYNTLGRLEDVWGGTDDHQCQDAIIFTWNDVINFKNN